MSLEIDILINRSYLYFDCTWLFAFVGSSETLLLLLIFVLMLILFPKVCSKIETRSFSDTRDGLLIFSNDFLLFLLPAALFGLRCCRRWNVCTPCKDWYFLFFIASWSFLQPILDVKAPFGNDIRLFHWHFEENSVSLFISLLTAIEISRK